MDRGLTFSAMEMPTLESIKMESLMEKDNTLGKMDLSMSESSRMD